MKVEIELTDRETTVLKQLAEEKGLPPARVLLQGLRLLQLVEYLQSQGWEGFPSEPKSLPFEEFTRAQEAVKPIIEREAANEAVGEDVMGFRFQREV